MKLLSALAGFFIFALILSMPAGAGNVFILSSPTAQAPPPTAPAIGGGGNTVTWTQGGAATAVDASITVSGTITGASVTITSGFVPGDLLNFTNTSTIIGTYNSGTGQLSLSGADSAANYQTAMRLITFSSPAASPTGSGSSTSRAVGWIGLNGSSGSTGVASTVNVVELPTLAGLGSGVAFTQGQGAVKLSPGLTVSDFSASNLTSASVSITATFLTGDTLACVACGSLTPSYNTGTGVLSLSGTATLAVYQTALASITYNFTGSDVTNGGTNLSRTIVWSVTDANSNASAATNSAELFTVSGLTPKPSWVPSWTGTGISCNYQVSQCWNGFALTVVAPTTLLATTRSTPESCELANSLTTAAPNVPCVNANGLGTWPASTNYIWPSDNVSGSSGNWVLYAPTPTQGTASISASYNTVAGPDCPGGLTANCPGAVGDASAITVARVGANTAVLIDNQITLPLTGTYTTSCWLKADSSVYTGTVIIQGLYDNVNQASQQLIPITLTANWVRYPMTFTVAGGSHIQLLIGLSPNGPNTQSPTVVFDVWRCQMEPGSIMTPSIQTVTAPITRPIDNILVTSTFSSLMAGATGSYEITAQGAFNGVATVLDSNGNTFAGETITGALTTSLPSPASTITTANWTTPTTAREGWDGTGRTFALNGSVIYTDTAVPHPAAPFYLGSTQGATNSFTGYIRMATVAPTRVSNSTIGLAAGGTNYYFSAAGSDSNNCTSTATPCSNNFATAASGGLAGTGAKINTIHYVPGDIINLNKGDTFTGCVLLSGDGGNVQSIPAQGLTVQSYGSAGARPLVTSQGVQCPGEFGIPTNFATSATIHLDNINGFLWNGVDVQCDTSGNNSRGFSLENTSAANNSNLTFENINFTQGCFDKTPTTFNTSGGAIFWDVSSTKLTSYNAGNSNGGVTGHVTVQNIVCSSPTPTTLTGPATCMMGSSYVGDQIQFDLVQGMLAYNLGGYYPAGTPNNPAAASSQGGGILTNGTIGTVTPQIFQYLVFHDNGANIPQSCGAMYHMWSLGGQNMIWQYIEAYNFLGNAGSCDSGGFDVDLGSSNITLQYNYTHHNAGPGYLMFIGSSGDCGTCNFPYGNITFRYNISDSDSVLHDASMNIVGNGNAVFPVYIYNNDIIQPTYGTNVSHMSSCPPAGSIYANNLHVFASNYGTASNATAQPFYGTVGCSRITFVNNGWDCFNCTPGDTSRYFFWWAGTQFNNAGVGGTAGWQGPNGPPGGDANAVFAVAPLFVGGIAGNATCYSATTAPTGDPMGGGSLPNTCPSAYKLQGGDTHYKGAGADLTTSTFGFLNVGTHDYYGVAIPSGGGSGYSIGASQ